MGTIVTIERKPDGVVLVGSGLRPVGHTVGISFEFTPDDPDIRGKNTGSEAKVRDDGTCKVVTDTWELTLMDAGDSPTVPPGEVRVPMKAEAEKVQVQVTGIAGTLTDGTGISAIDLTKFLKDFVADTLLSGAAALVAVQIVDVGSAVEQPQVVAFALLGAVIRSAYRAGLRWATT